MNDVLHNLASNVSCHNELHLVLNKPQSVNVEVPVLSTSTYKYIQTATFCQHSRCSAGSKTLRMSQKMKLFIVVLSQSKLARPIPWEGGVDGFDWTTLSQNQETWHKISLNNQKRDQQRQFSSSKCTTLCLQLDLCPLSWTLHRVSLQHFTDTQAGLMKNSLSGLCKSV